MKIINEHKRIIHQPKDNISKLVEKLSSKDDKIWPYEHWPAIKFKDGLKVGSKGGHGIIRYTITEYDPNHIIKFQFSKPKGFNGTHEFRIQEVSQHQTEIKHLLQVNTSFVATFQWYLFIRWLHDALIEDAFDKVENHFSSKKKVSSYSVWVKLWRWLLAPKSRKNPKPSYH